jgi:nitroimidazol reductase NimA-like FMN-containing flavoprotein (pyridoxamine 5'-phosphate oxidase superfamily)
MSHEQRASYDDVSIYDLSPEREQELLEKQVECVFMWSNRDGHPIGVVMNYIYHDGRIWLTATSQRARIRAIRRDPRVSVTISSMGTDMGAGKTVTYKGSVRIHDDQATKDWFYPKLAELLNGYPATSVEAAIEMLDTPLRVILELVPEKAIRFDGDKVAEMSRRAAQGA